MELSDYRQQIDGIDSQLLALFYQRMEVAAQIAGYKKAHNLPALDAGRERAKLQQIADAAPEDLREYAVSLYSLIFELSRSCQNRLLTEKPNSATAVVVTLKAVTRPVPNRRVSRSLCRLETTVPAAIIREMIPA